MCGRFALSEIPRSLLDLFGLRSPVLSPRYNVAPTQQMPVVLLESGQPAVQALRWGLIPSWAKEKGVGARSINARAETVADKPTFKGPFQKRRCLVPSTGFYEWMKGERKTPYYFTAADQNQPVVFAGLWDEWRHESERVRSFTILTTAADSRMAPFHHRMPVLLPPGHWSGWLEGSPQEAAGILASGETIPLEYWPVDSYVTKSGNEGAACIESIV